jgi:hypothetical protein
MSTRKFRKAQEMVQKINYLTSCFTNNNHKKEKKLEFSVS